MKKREQEQFGGHEQCSLDSLRTVKSSYRQLPTALDDVPESRGELGQTLTKWRCRLGKEEGTEICYLSSHISIYPNGFEWFCWSDMYSLKCEIFSGNHVVSGDSCGHAESCAVVNFSTGLR